MQAVLLVALALLVVPAGHARQELSSWLPEAGLKVEGGQALHWEAPGEGENLPGGQGRQKEASALPVKELNVPGLHGAQAVVLVLPFVLPKVPRGQCWQELGENDPLSGVKVPMGH